MKQRILLTILLINLSACGSQTTYRPSIYGHDFETREIITPSTHIRISCGAREFNKYVSVSLKDLSKLALVLKNAKVPRKVRILIEGFGKEVALRKKQNEKLLK
jgi:hypothetical protein